MFSIKQKRVYLNSKFFIKEKKSYLKFLERTCGVSLGLLYKEDSPHEIKVSLQKKRKLRYLCLLFL